MISKSLASLFFAFALLLSCVANAQEKGLSEGQISSGTDQEVYNYFIRKVAISSDEYEALSAKKQFPLADLVGCLWAYAIYVDPLRKDDLIAAALAQGYYDALLYLGDLGDTRIAKRLQDQYTDFQIHPAKLAKWIELNQDKTWFDMKQRKFTNRVRTISYDDISQMPREQLPDKITLVKTVDVKVTLPGGAGSAEVKQPAGTQVTLERVEQQTAFVKGVASFELPLDETDILDLLQQAKPYRKLANKQSSEVVSAVIPKQVAPSTSRRPAVAAPVIAHAVIVPGAVSSQLDSGIPLQYFSNAEVDEKDFRKVYKGLEDLLQGTEPHFVALAVLNIENGAYIEMTYGWNTEERKVPAAAGGIVPLVKMTQLITAALVQDHADIGRIELKDEYMEVIGDQLMGSVVGDKTRRMIKDVTLWELIDLQYQIGSDNFWDSTDFSIIRNPMEVLRLACFDETSKTKTIKSHSRISSIILGEVIKILSGQSYLKEVQKLLPEAVSIREGSTASPVCEDFLSNMKVSPEIIEADAGVALTMKKFLEFYQNRNFYGKFINEQEQAGYSFYRYRKLEQWNTGMKRSPQGVLTLIILAGDDDYLDQEYQEILDQMIELGGDSKPRGRK